VASLKLRESFHRRDGATAFARAHDFQARFVATRAARPLRSWLQCRSARPRTGTQRGRPVHGRSRRTVSSRRVLSGAGAPTARRGR
jgi:hypothetical protein